MRRWQHRAGERYTVHIAGPDRQVGALAHGVGEITDGGWNPFARGTDCNRANEGSVLPRAVLIIEAGMTVLLKGRKHGAHRR